MAQWIAGASLRGPWLLSIDHLGVVAEVGDLTPSPVTGLRHRKATTAALAWGRR